MKKIVYHGTNIGQKKIPLLRIKYGKKMENFTKEGRNNYIKKRGYKRGNDCGYYFSPSPEIRFNLTKESTWSGAQNYGKYVYSVLLNLKRPTDSDFALGLNEEIVNKLKNLNYDSIIATNRIMSAGLTRKSQLTRSCDYDSVVEYIVFEPEQIHILGSKKDIKGFENFIKESDNFSPPKK